MEFDLAQWGPAGVMLGVLIVIVRWLLGHMDTLHKDNKELVTKYLTDSRTAQLEHTSAIKENTVATRELKTMVGNCSLVQSTRGAGG